MFSLYLGIAHKSLKYLNIKSVITLVSPLTMFLFILYFVISGQRRFGTHPAPLSAHPLASLYLFILFSGFFPI